MLWKVFWALLLLFSFTVAFHEGAHKEEILEELPSEALKEALRQVFRIPDKIPTPSGKSSERPLRFMMRLYRKILAGQSKLPKQANTIRSVMPFRVPSPSFQNNRRHSLLYNLTTSQQERVMTSYLHLMGHRTPIRPSRILFFLDSGNSSGYDNKPLMVAFMKKMPMDVDVTRLIQKALEEKPPLFIRLQEEQLRRGEWVTSSIRRLNKMTPLLIVVSADPQLLDLEAFGVGALHLRRSSLVKEASSHKNNVRKNYYTDENKKEISDEASRLRRSIEPNSSPIENEITTDHNRPIVKAVKAPEKKPPKDKYWIQKQSIGVIKSEDNLPVSSFNEEEENSPFSPLFTNEFNHRFSSPAFEGRRPPPDNVTRTKDDIEIAGSFDRHKEKYDIINKKENKRNKLLSQTDRIDDNQDGLDGGDDGDDIYNNNEDDSDDDEMNLDSKLLPPAKEFKQFPRSKKTKPKRKNKERDKLIPYPEYYVSWEKWESPQSARWRRRYRRGKKNKKNGKIKSKRIPNHWLQVGMNRISNDAVRVASPSTHSVPNEVCNRHEFFVDFRQLGWEKFIVAPKGFETFFCAGRCPSPLSQVDAGTNHAIVQSLLRAANLSPELPNACCVPSKLDSISILLTEEEDRLVLRTFPNMVVKSCSCQ